MQEEVEQKTITLAVNAAKFTGRVLKEAISRHVQNTKTSKRDKSCVKSGRVTMRQLQKQYGDLRSVTIDDENTRQFERIARKYHVQYKVYRCEKGKYQIFFKSPNAEAMNAAFEELLKVKMRKEDREPITQTLQRLKEQLAGIGNKIRRKELER